MTESQAGHLLGLLVCLFIGLFALCGVLVGSWNHRDIAGIVVFSELAAFMIAVVGYQIARLTQ